MNPTVARGGSSFRGAFLYYMHDPKAATRERIAWTHPVNILTHDPDRAWKVMAYTAKHQDRLKEAAGGRMTGRKAEKPVLAYSLSWHPEQTPAPEHMREVALQSLKALGLQEHEAFIVAHSDTKHRHVHVIANRIHPLTGKVASDSYTFLKLSDFALQYAQTHGLAYSPQRAENKRKREEGKQASYRDNKIAEAWAASDSGKGFVTALAERGYALAQGNKRLVVVDPYGKIHNPTRHIEGIRAKDLKARLQDLDLTALPDAEEIALTHETRHGEKKAARKAELKAADVAASFTKAATPSPDAPTSPANVKEQIATRVRRLEERHQREASEIVDRFRVRLVQERDELTRALRLPELAGQIEKLRVKCEKPSIWRRLFGLTRRDRRELEALDAKYATAKSRIDDRVRVMQDGHARTLEILRSVQQRELDTTLKRAFQKAHGVEDRLLRKEQIKATYKGLDYER